MRGVRLICPSSEKRALFIPATAQWVNSGCQTVLVGEGADKRLSNASEVASNAH